MAKATYYKRLNSRKHEKGNLEIHSSDAGGNPYRYSDHPRRDQLFRCIKKSPVTFKAAGDYRILRVELGTYSTHNTHIFYRHPIFELKIDNCSLRLIKLKQVIIDNSSFAS